MRTPFRGQTQFAIRMPWQGATRMTCSDANCQNKANGWATVLNPNDDAGAKTAEWIKFGSGRRFIELRSDTALNYLELHHSRLGLTVTPALSGLLQRTPPGMLVFLFPPGQECFRPHLDREVTFLHDRYEHVKPRDFQEDHNEHIYEYVRTKERG